MICTGCGKPFFKTHQLLNHRRTFRCGGEWNEEVYFKIPDGLYYDIKSDTMKVAYIEGTRPGRKYFPGCTLPDVRRPIAAEMRRRARKKAKKCRTPGVMRKSRLPGGPGYRGMPYGKRMQKILSMEGQFDVA